MSKKLHIKDAIRESKTRTTNIGATKIILAQAELDKKQADKDLEDLIALIITHDCSDNFIDAMEAPITKEVKSARGFGACPNNYLEYLTRIIFFCLSENPITTGFEHFIVPGENRGQGFEFTEKYSNDFKVISQIFELSIGPVPDVTIGYAYEIKKA